MIYAIGDIHGELEKLNRLIASLPLERGDRLIFLGDYIDRGPDSAGVVARLIELSRQYECRFLIGNHESMFLDFLGWRKSWYFGGDAFLMNGGARTLSSYGYFGQEDPEPTKFDLPPAHVKFYEGLELFLIEGDYLFVHAGLGEKGIRSGDVNYAVRASRPEDLLWNRSTIEMPHDLGITIIYGHTPRSDFGVRHNEPFSIGVDTGAAYGGPLTAVRLPDETLYSTD